MVATLPRNIQLKLNQALNQWHQWRCEPPLTAPPVVVSQLGAGISNHSILVAAGQRFVIRIDGVQPASNGLSRSTEWRTMHAAHAAGLAPCPRYFNPEIGVLVCDYLPPDDAAPGNIRETAALLRRIHRLPATHYRLDLRERINQYERQLKHQNQHLPASVTSSREEIMHLLDILEAQSDTPVLCHNDLLGANRIRSGNRLWAIDWEYCAMGSPWFDLAVIAVGDALDSDGQEQLMNAYLGRAASERETGTLARYCHVYRYLEQLWFLANQTEKH